MSDTMLLGVLCMPPELWTETELDRQQRYSRYLQAARRIEDDAREMEALRKDAERYRWLREHTSATGLARFVRYSGAQFLDEAVDRLMAAEAPAGAA